jgi:uncharacterized OB-fold protein
MTAPGRSGQVGQFGLPVLAQPEVPELAPYWAAAAAGRLVLPQCLSCGFVIWYPRAFCPACGTADVEWIDSPGLGTVYSCTVTRHGPGRYRGVGPYVLAYVELDEGPRVLTNIVGGAPERVQIGQRVLAVFDQAVLEGRGPVTMLRFRPVPTDGEDSRT